MAPGPTNDERSEESGNQDPWDGFASDLRGLGNRLQQTYRSVAEERGPSDDEIRGAFSVLASAWDQVSGTVSSALQDPELRDNLRSAASSFATAIGRTIADLGDELAKSPQERGSDEEE